jgi:hypothetical protein
MRQKMLSRSLTCCGSTHTGIRSSCKHGDHEHNREKDKKEASHEFSPFDERR